MHIGIDVGGTNTDAVLMQAMSILAEVKTPTRPDITSGITTALQTMLAQVKTDPAQITAVMIGTTHFTDAVVERRGLMPTAALRLGLPTQFLPPMVDWPSDLRQAIRGQAYLAHGGYEFDGRLIAPLDPAEIRDIAGRIGDEGIRSVAISSVFSPVNAAMEKETAAIIQEVIPGAATTLSHEIGRIGLLERENAAIMNACLRDLAKQIVAAFRQAMADMQIEAPLYLTQNNGTLMGADFVERYPVLTFASGPTNSIRGAAFLTGARDAMVVDIGGTTTDLGMLVRGFPREAPLPVEIGGVRTNLRMPDVLSLGLGGGSLVSLEPLRIGPRSVGCELTTRSLVFDGTELTATDVAVAAGLADIGQPSAVAGLSSHSVERVLQEIQHMVEQAVDRMKTSAAPVPVVLVGGGSILVRDSLNGAAEVIRPDYFAVANAVGAAIARIGGEVDRVFSLAHTSSDAALQQAREEASAKAVAAGADPNTIQVVDVEEIPLAYLPGSATRIRVKVTGDMDRSNARS